MDTSGPTRGAGPTPAARAGLPLFLRGRSLFADATGEREADSIAARAAPDAPSGSAGPHDDSPRRLAPENRQYFETQLGTDLSGVRIHSGPASSGAALDLAARAFAVGEHIVFGAGEYAPQRAAGRHLLAHELAHVARHRGDPHTVRLKRLEDASPAEQQALSVPSSSVNISKEKLKEYFEKVGGDRWGSYKSAPSGVKVELSGIDAAMLVPMTSIAMHMRDDMSYSSTVTGQTKPIFGPGMTVNVFLALAAHGLTDGVYRFSWAGDGKTGTIYIETFGARPADQNKVTDSSGTLTVGSLTFEHTGGWADARLDALTQALKLIPEAALKAVDGMKFKLDSGAAPKGEDGHYEEDKHRVVIYTSAFRADDLRRAGVFTWAVYAIAHEIGHAIDLAPLRAAWKAYGTSGSGADLKKAASESGSKWEESGNKWEIAERIKQKDVDFRKAAVKDGVDVTTTKVTTEEGAKADLTHLKGGVTEYSNTNWTELYAESFAMYTTDPATLKLIRPNIYAFLEKRFPRKP